MHGGFRFAVGLPGVAIAQNDGSHPQWRQLDADAPACMLGQAQADGFLLGQQVIEYGKLRAVHAGSS